MQLFTPDEQDARIRLDDDLGIVEAFHVDDAFHAQRFPVAQGKVVFPAYGQVLLGLRHSRRPPLAMPVRDIATAYATSRGGMTDLMAEAQPTSIPQPANFDAVEEKLHDIFGRPTFTRQFVRVPLTQADAVSDAGYPCRHTSSTAVPFLDALRLHLIRAY